MTDMTKITEALREFRDERNWAQFHNPKDLAIALSIEANELLEEFLWKSANEAELSRIKDELADVFSYAFLIADKYGLDVLQIINDKIEKNKLKYPVEKAKNSATKYTKL